MNTTLPLCTQADASALLQETVDFYALNPVLRRAMQDVGDVVDYGVYATEDGRQCAIGRCLMDPLSVQENTSESGTSFRMVARQSRVGFDSLFQPRYRGYPLQLWMKLSRLHDHSPYWSATGLSEKGCDEVASIRDWIARESSMPIS